MDIQSKDHALSNYVIGSVGMASPLWMQLLSEATGLLQFFTALGGAILIAYQLYKTYNLHKREKINGNNRKTPRRKNNKKRV